MEQRGQFGSMMPAGGFMPMGGMAAGPMGHMISMSGMAGYPGAMMPMGAMPHWRVPVVWNQPFYAVDFGTGVPHLWYAHEELVPAPGAQPGQRVSMGPM